MILNYMIYLQVYFCILLVVFPCTFVFVFSTAIGYTYLQLAYQVFFSVSVSFLFTGWSFSLYFFLFVYFRLLPYLQCLSIIMLYPFLPSAHKGLGQRKIFSLKASWLWNESTWNRCSIFDFEPLLVLPIAISIYAHGLPLFTLAPLALRSLVILNVKSPSNCTRDDHHWCQWR